MKKKGKNKMGMDTLTCVFVCVGILACVGMFIYLESDALDNHKMDSPLWKSLNDDASESSDVASFGEYLVLNLDFVFTSIVVGVSIGLIAVALVGCIGLISQIPKCVWMIILTVGLIVAGIILIKYVLWTLSFHW